MSSNANISDELLDNFCSVTGADKERARFYLEQNSSRPEFLSRVRSRNSSFAKKRDNEKFDRTEKSRFV